MRVQCLVICIDYDECDPLVYKCNKTKDVLLCLSHTIGYIDRYSKQWSHDRCIASKCLWVLFKQLVNRKSVTGTAFKKYLDLML